MRSISLPGLVLWLPLGSPAACLEHTQPVALNRRTKKHPPDSLSLAFLWLLASSDAAWLKDFPECTTLRSHCRRRRLQRSILKPRPSSFFVPHSQPYASRHPPPLLLSNAPASGIRGPQVTPPPSPGPPLAGSSLFYNLCSLLLHRHAPSHSYTGVVISLELLLTVKTTAAAHQNIFNKSKDWTRSSWDLHCYFKPTWCLGAIRSTEFHTHLVASVLVYPAIVVQYCVIVQSFWPVIVFLPDKVSVVVVLKDKFTPKKKRRKFSRYLLTPPRADGKSDECLVISVTFLQLQNKTE